MPQPLLKTKLYVPSARREQIARPRLIQQLNAGAQAKLTLVSASAGSGKTTLLAQWLDSDEARKRSTAWLSLDEDDNREVSFWSYVIGALQSVVPSAGATAMALLESSQPASIQPILTTLINDLSDLAQAVVLVLDDYHVIETRQIHDGLTFLLSHLPAQLHLVIASRADPPLPLPLLRARGDLVEVRVAELRFRPDEAAAYLNDVMRLRLSEGEVAALETRTEGWIAALQLAALSMQGHDDVAAFIAEFAGDDRYIVDYLVEEVLQRQTAHVRRFLLETSILERLSGPLCAAVTGRTDASSMLEALDRGNLFVVALDDRRRWYRYHHLFGEVLRAHLVSERSGELADLHRRASRWYAQNDASAEAIRHAFLARDFAYAADLIERAVAQLRKTRQEATLHAWLAALPDEVLRVRPVLNTNYAWVGVAMGNFDGLEVRLAEVERSLDPTRPDDVIVVNAAEYRRVPAVMALLRTANAQARGDVAATITFARQVLDLAAEDDDLLRGAAAGFLGLAYWSAGDIAQGHRMYADCMHHIERAGHLADVAGCAIALADMCTAQGRLHEALRTYEYALQVVTSQGAAVLRGAADMYVGMADVYRERNDLEVAVQHLVKSKELGQHAELPQNAYRWCVTMARVRQTQGELTSALELLDEAQRLYIGDFFPNVRPIAAFKARAWLAQGNVQAAVRWADERELSADVELSYRAEFEHITLARVLLATGSIKAAERLLERLLTAARAGERTGSVIEILVLQALASGACAPLERALALAEPEGYVRMFVDEGPRMQALLHKLTPTRYSRHLLAAFGSQPIAAPVSADATQALLEPLSERELEVLRLLGSDLDGPDIASELMVSLNTLRTHTRSIYAKLGVNSRRAAVRRAEELDLLSPTRAR